MRGGWCCQGISIQNQRPSNMDRILCQKRLEPEGEVVLAAVSDGVGSARDGAYASEYTVKSLSAWLEYAGSARLGLSLRDHVLKVNREIVDIASRDGLDTAATLSALLILGGRYALVHVGDSRIYQYDREGLRQLTRDDTSPNGRLTVCLGHWRQIMAQYEEGEAEGKTFLLCTDGLYKGIGPEMLEEKLSREKERRKDGFLEALIQQSVRQGETDNISAILIQRKK